MEITAAIGDLRTGKSPGPDGYPPEFLKKCKDKLAPIMLEVFNESLRNGYFPPTLTQAKITLLLKKDKDPTNCGSYRPISLLNVDIKILAKVMAHRLESVLPKVISEDQTGFIKGRHSFSNIRRLANVIYSPGPSLTAEAVISLDVERLLTGWSGNTCFPYWKGLDSVTRFWHGFVCSIRPHKLVFKLINPIPNFFPCHVGHVKDVHYPRSYLQ